MLFIVTCRNDELQFLWSSISKILFEVVFWNELPNGRFFWGIWWLLFPHFKNCACLEREGLGCRVVIYFDMHWSLHNLFTLEIRMRNLLMLFWEICILCTITWLMKMHCRTGKICGSLSSQEEFQWLILPERLLVQFWSIGEHHTIQTILIRKLLVGRLLFSRIWHYWQTRYSYRNDIWSLHVIAWQLILFVKVCFFIHMNAYVSVFFSFSYI